MVAYFSTLPATYLVVYVCTHVQNKKIICERMYAYTYIHMHMYACSYVCMHLINVYMYA